MLYTTRISANSKMVQKCKDFAWKLKRNIPNYNTRYKKVRHTTHGTIFEHVVCKYLRDLGFKCSKPDLNIYTDKSKCVVDLMVGDIEIHCKSHIPYQNYPISFAYNKNSKYKHTGIHAYGVVELLAAEYKVDILGFYNGNELKGKYKDGIKVKKYDWIYYKDVVGSEIDITTTLKPI